MKTSTVIRTSTINLNSPERNVTLPAHDNAVGRRRPGWHARSAQCGRWRQGSEAGGGARRHGTGSREASPTAAENRGRDLNWRVMAGEGREARACAAPRARGEISAAAATTTTAAAGLRAARVRSANGARLSVLGCRPLLIGKITKMSCDQIACDIKIVCFLLLYYV